MYRRDFLKTSSMAAIGTMIIPSFLEGCANGGAINQSEALAFAMDHFGVTPTQLKKVLSEALSLGGDYADLFFEHTIDSTVSMQDGKVNNASNDVDFGVGIRVLSGDQTGYAYVEDVSYNEMVKAARTAARIANSGATTKPVDLTEVPIVKNYYPIIKSWDNLTIKDKIPYLQRLNDKIFSLDKRVVNVIASLNNNVSHILFCNSEGMIAYDYRPMGSLRSNCVMSDKGRTETYYEAVSLRSGAEMLTDEMVDQLAKESVDKTALLFECVQPKGGEMPVVMGCGGSGILLHEAIGHAFEADFNRMNTSIFSDMLNKKICSDGINILDDGTIAGNRGSVNIDDEGIEGKKTYLVKDGVLTSYIHDRISAKHYGVEPTGNGRRESFRYMPVPRMRATYMESDKYSEEEIIASVKNGVYASSFTNGQVQIGAGDFTFFVKYGYLIENGKLTQPIKDVNIIGNGPQALADITMVGNNYKMDTGTWTCGKSGQSVPVACGMPSALVKKLTVGGN